MLDQRMRQEGDRVLRFSVSDRAEHWVQMVTFTVLAYTGLIQKWPEGWFSQFSFRAMGGVESVRLIHRGFATVLLLAIVYHLYTVGRRVYVERAPRAMIPTKADLKAISEQFAYIRSRRKAPPRQGRFTWDEKLEYWAVVWGTVIMTITGFMLWNPIATASFLPGQFIPAAKAAHSGEALLAVLAILVWHIYNVHVRHFNKSMFTGYLSREEMAERHALELEAIDTGIEPPANGERARRQEVFLRGYGVMAVVLLVGIYFFVTFEDTAIDTIEPPEIVEVFVRGPQPTIPVRPTAPPTVPTTTLPDQVDTWDATIGPLFASSCGGCHGTSAAGGLDLTSYESALAGGEGGPGVVPRDPEASSVIVVQSAGGHPAQFDEDQLSRISEWIAEGAPEN